MAIISTPPQEELIDQRSVTTPDKMGLPFIFAKARLTTAWTTFFSNAYQILLGLTLSGLSANRPTKYLYIGRPYFDTSLGANGKPIWVASVNSSGVATWVDSASNIV